MTSITIYDTDHLNPYGRELASQLDRRVKVHYIGCTAMQWRPQLTDARYTVRLGVDKANRLTVGASALLNSLRCCLRVARGAQLIILWPRSLVEAIPLGLTALLTRRVLFMLHNPRPRSGQPRSILASQWLLRRSCHLLVHSQRLLTVLDARERRRANVVGHPPYMNYMTDHVQAGVKAASGKTNVLFLGHLRADKTPEELIRVVGALPNPRDVRLLFCGKGNLGDLRYRLQKEVEVDDRMCATGASDETLVKALMDADVLCAPYKEATQSGSVILALTAGLHVVAYDSGAIADFRDRVALVPTGDAVAMAQSLYRWTQAAGGDSLDSTGQVQDWSREAMSTWLKALAA